jgi:hypothetical protein
LWCFSEHFRDASLNFFWTFSQCFFWLLLDIFAVLFLTFLEHFCVVFTN